MLKGAVLDVAVDVRVGSPTFGRHVKVELNGDNRRQFWVPRGFAHGFVCFPTLRTFSTNATNFIAPRTNWCSNGTIPRSASTGVSRHRKFHSGIARVGARQSLRNSCPNFEDGAGCRR